MSNKIRIRLKAYEHRSLDLAASKIVEREINKEDNEKLVEDFLKSK